MARLEYVVKDSATPEVGEVFAKLEARGARVINLYRMLGHSPAALLPFIKMGNSLLTRAKLDARTRELAILRIAGLNGSKYEYQQHTGLAGQVGVTAPQKAALSDWERSEAFDAKDRAVLRYVDEMVRNVAVSDEVFAALGRYFDETEIVELTLSVGFWDMVARFLVALQVDLEEGSGASGSELLGGGGKP